VADDTRPDSRALSARGRPDDRTCDVFAWPPTGPGLFEQKHLTAIDREGVHLDERFVGIRRRLERLTDPDERARSVSWQQREHGTEWSMSSRMTVSRLHPFVKGRLDLSSDNAVITGSTRRSDAA
jgi:hypothetical protein